MEVEAVTTKYNWFSSVTYRIKFNTLQSPLIHTPKLLLGKQKHNRSTCKNKIQKIFSLTMSSSQVYINFSVPVNKTQAERRK